MKTKLTVLSNNDYASTNVLKSQYMAFYAAAFVLKNLCTVFKLKYCAS